MKRLLLCAVWFMSCPPAAVSTPAPPPTPKPPSEQTELEALLLSIPPACAASEPLETITCPPKQADLSGACVVERYDTRTQRLTDRLVYAGELLVTNLHVVSAHTDAVTTFTWDDKHRLEEKTTCFTAGKGEPEWAPAWRPPLAVFEEALTQVTRTRVTYDGDSSRPVFAQLDSSAPSSGYRMKLCYAYDEQGRRARRIQTYRDRTPATLQVESRKYLWADQRLGSIGFRSVVLKERAVAGGGQYRVSFGYDEQGRLSEQTTAHAKQPPSSVRLEYDPKGRLRSYGAVTFDWDGAGRLTGLHPQDPALDGVFSWDESGRIKSAKFKNGEGFYVTYSRTCPAGFSPPPVTPSVDGYLFYEGKDEL